MSLIKQVFDQERKSKVNMEMVVFVSIRNFKWLLVEEFETSAHISYVSQVKLVIATKWSEIFHQANIKIISFRCNIFSLMKKKLD